MQNKEEQIKNRIFAVIDDLNSKQSGEIQLVELVYDDSEERQTFNPPQKKFDFASESCTLAAYIL